MSFWTSLYTVWIPVYVYNRLWRYLCRYYYCYNVWFLSVITTWTTTTITTTPILITIWINFGNFFIAITIIPVNDFWCVSLQQCRGGHVRPVWRRYGANANHLCCVSHDRNEFGLRQSTPLRLAERQLPQRIPRDMGILLRYGQLPKAALHSTTTQWNQWTPSHCRIELEYR